VIATLEPEVRRHDPRAALDGGADGLDAYRAILAGVARRPGLLSERGALVLEIGYDQGPALTGLAQATGFAPVRVGRDLAGNDRV
ncbi:MAG: protein-(glutamine-N5) methyltransferase, release factor-specific, partial [Xanthomonas perforans]|nr:protein-(glutamine-N5) methyltransferase, release factor-specific [Xanthomonas perforans]